MTEPSYTYFEPEAATMLVRKVVENRTAINTNALSLNSVIGRLNTLTKKLNVIEKYSNVTVLDTTNVTGYYNITDKDLIALDLVMSDTVNTLWTLIGKSVEVTDSYANGVNVNITTSDANGDVTITNLTSTGSSANNNANATINCNKVITIENSNLGQTGTEAIAIGLDADSSKATGITIRNCDFTGTLSGSAIVIRDVANNCVVNIENCHFSSAEHVLTFQNNSNATGVAINFVNCTWDAITADASTKCVALFKDNISQDATEAATNNLFDSNKVTISFVNCTGENSTPITAPEQFVSVCGAGEGKLVGVCSSDGTIVNYTEQFELYPAVSITHENS